MTDAGERQRAAIGRLLSDLRRLSNPETIIVFGSVAKGAVEPGDVDIMLTDNADAGAALALARRHYPLLDVFVEQGGVLFVRNAEATGWEQSRCSREMRHAIDRDGISLSQVQGYNQGDRP